MKNSKPNTIKPLLALKLPNQGFTLFELLIVISITAILILLTTPSFKAYSAQSTSKAIIQKLSGLVRLARNNAIYHQHPTILCPSKDGIQCSQSWQDGALILEDNNNNQKVDNTEAVIHFQSPLIEQGELRWTALRNYLSISGQGLSGSSAGSFIYCPEANKPNYAQALIVSFSGKIRIAEDANNDGIRESGNAKNIVCL